jgi:hypothetical protein
MRKTVSTLVGLVLAAVALTPTAANASSIESIAGVPPRDGALEEISEIVGAGVDRVVLLTGNYEYNCVGADGSSYFLASGAPLTDCKGQFLQKYLDGSMLDSIDLAYGGGRFPLPHLRRTGASSPLPQRSLWSSSRRRERSPG